MEKFDVRKLSTIGTVVVEMIDFKTSAEKQRTVVKVGVDDALDELKRLDDGLEDLLCQVYRDIADTTPVGPDLGMDVLFIPQIGFLISILMDNDTGQALFEGDVGERGWERIFSTSNAVFYKDQRMREFDETFGDVYAMICDREIEIIHELAQRLLESEITLCEISDICGELDR